MLLKEGVRLVEGVLSVKRVLSVEDVPSRSWMFSPEADCFLFLLHC